MKILNLLLLVWPLSVFSQPVSDKINALVEGYYQEGKFNGVILVAQKGNVLFEKAWGYADMEEEVLNELDTRFLIGSTTKSFTAVSVLQLVDQGTLDLHMPIGRYLPALKKDLGEKLTLHLLMKMSSGLPPHLNRITELKYKELTESELVEIINQSKLSFEPGSQYEYSNLNYQLAAVVVAKVSGKSFKEYLKNYTIQPLKMKDSGLESFGDRIFNKAKGYEMHDQKMIPAPKNYMSYALGSGDMYSTARDLLKWDQALYQNSYLTESAKQLLFDGEPDKFGGYGYGFKVKRYVREDNSTGKLVRHGGTMQGFICNVHRYLDDELVIIVLGNIRPYPIMEITTAIEKIIFSME